MPAPPAAAASPAYALASAVLRTRAEAEQVQAAMAALLGRAGAVRTEILPVGDDWRVAGWPYAHPAEAERARLLLAARGLRVSVLAF
ncbi:MAG: hypothetical protein KGI90_09515 [Burkholderiales bacterium]|nr:hypothetical protein [Burkholderiales bacterium]MDE2277170.1 hypothetical protein [Burkholderiales bacterium]